MKHPQLAMQRKRSLNSNSSSLKQEKLFNLERFFNLSPDILCIAGFDGYLKKVNPAFSNLLGYSEKELLQRPINDFIYEDDKSITSVLREKIKNNIPLLNFENRYVTKRGDIVWLSWTSISEKNDDLIYAVAKNITHIKKLEEERNLLLIDLAKLNADLKKFTYTTSHDLRSPVGNIISLFDLLDFSKIKDKETLEYLQLLRGVTFEMKATLDKYVDAITEDKKINIQVEKLNFQEILDNVCESIQELINKSETIIQVDFSKAETVEFSSFYLHSIFLNLISNSIKYAHSNRKPVVSIRTRKINNRIQLIFSDNGIGFDMKKAEGKIFGLNQSLHSKKESKGIGLYLVQSHLESLGGKINVKSKVNKGTTFTLSFRD
ncbi:ATP-binding protein [Mesonia maritima]|uniref:histidine kinase n=2 Tax=Mesonia maritima TaxID=1793873 RepID=A0ABU1K7E3_9FLAO|nr:PAS domain S-box-containing protein [Mesonia maritima]